FQHRVGLAHPGRGAEEDSQPPAPRSRFLPLNVSQQLVRIAALGLGHRSSAVSAAHVQHALQCHTRTEFRQTASTPRYSCPRLTPALPKALFMPEGDRTVTSRLLP